MEWNADHVKSWLGWCAKAFSLRPSPEPQTLEGCSGRDILDWNLDKWREKLPESGRVLARHLGYLRLQASGHSTEALLQEEKSASESSARSAGIIYFFFFFFLYKRIFCILHCCSASLHATARILYWYRKSQISL